MHFAHGHDVLHGDLKPSNVLFDSHGRPHVSDFSVAQTLNVGGDDVGYRGGTYPYMAPEQAGVIDDRPSFGTDVYGLGALLYELLAGTPPRAESSLGALTASFKLDPRPPPLRLPDELSDLEAICTRALQFEPHRRYPDAGELAADLRRLQRGQWLPWRSPTRLTRLLHWTVAKPITALALVLGALGLGAIGKSSYDTLQAYELNLRQATIATNSALARAQAQSAQHQLVVLADLLLETADKRSPEFLPLVIDKRPQSVDLGPAPPGFDSLFAITCDGLVRGHSLYDRVTHRKLPVPARYATSKFDFRDYFKGAVSIGRGGGREVYVSRVIRSAWDGRLKFMLSVPLYKLGAARSRCESEHGMVGALVAGHSVSSTFGALQIPTRAVSRQRTVLIGPRDRDDALAPLPRPHVYQMIAHEHLKTGSSATVDTELAAELFETFGPSAAPGHQLDSSLHGRHLERESWGTSLDATSSRFLGSYYPVGQTGFLLGVETEYDDALSASKAMGHLLILIIGYGVFAVAAAWFAVNRALGRVKRPPLNRPA